MSDAFIFGLIWLVLTIVSLYAVGAWNEPAAQGRPNRIVSAVAAIPLLGAVTSWGQRDAARHGSLRRKGPADQLAVLVVTWLVMTVAIAVRLVSSAM